jgi:hypothetical protein
MSWITIAVTTYIVAPVMFSFAILSGDPHS